MIIFVSFQYEHLIDQNQWKLFESFGFMDAIGISSYPHKKHSDQFGDPSALADDYYSQICDNTNKPVVFAELGWSADPAFGGSSQKQAEFLNLFFDKLIKNMNVKLVNWWFLYDNVGHGEFFNKMGLKDTSTGLKRPAWDVYESN